MEPLFTVNTDCLHCSRTFQTSRVRPSFKKPYKTDSDFCAHFKEVNPDFYVVRVCPTCGFASTENFSNKFGDARKLAFAEKVASKWDMRDYGGERSWEDALETYKLALICAQMKEESDRIIAGILHHIAWLYRYKEDGEQEKRFLAYALDAYVSTYEVEGVSLNNARLMYMLGELNRRLGNFHEAVRWFTRVINDKKITDAGMIRACREQWAAAREDMVAAKMELPEEMKEGMK